MTESMGVGKAKRTAKDRDGWECQFCGMTNDEHTNQYDRGLHAHHIVKDGDDGADHPRNLITVCRDCHNTLENTQADALSRIKNEHVEDPNEELREEIYDLEGEIDKLGDENAALRDALGDLQSLKLVVYAVHETKLVTSELRYVGTDEDQATKAFKDCENHATLETATVRPSEEAVESFLEDRENLPEKIADELGGGRR